MENIMNNFIVSEDTEIILNGRRYLLEEGDIIILEGLTPEGIVRETADNVREKIPELKYPSYNFSSLKEKDKNDDIIKLIVSEMQNIRKREGTKMRVSVGYIQDVINRLEMLANDPANIDAWKNYEAGSKEKIDTSGLETSRRDMEKLRRLKEKAKNLGIPTNISDGRLVPLMVDDEDKLNEFINSLPSHELPSTIVQHVA